MGVQFHPFDLVRPASGVTEKRFEAAVDVAVVGLGLIGSAALRHVANAGLTAVGIGPGEPDVMADHDGPFASHFDSGRITRRIDARREWAVLASRAIAEYPALDAASIERSGHPVHTPAGLVFVRNDTTGRANQIAVAEELDIPITVGTTDRPGVSLPGLELPAGWTTIYEGSPAGHIDPRRMVEAQLALAEQAGASIVRATARSAARSEEGFHIAFGDAGDGGDHIVADRVLLATGPYPSDLLVELGGEQLQTSVRPEAVVLGEVDPDDDRTSRMPSVIWLLDHPELDDVYIVPPVRYPDGKTYVKMGGSRRTAPRFVSVEEKRQWMSGDEADEQLPIMRAVLEGVLSETQFLSWQMKPCLITDTASHLPYVDRIDHGLFVAIGGNGHAAKSSDGIGALAASLLRNNGEWTDPDLDQAAFAARFGAFDPGLGSRHGA